MKHISTQPAILNFNKLANRILQINTLQTYSKFHNTIDSIIKSLKPTLLMATGGSKACAYYFQMLFESKGIICEVIEPRDYFYKKNIDCFQNLMAISSSGKSNGILEALEAFSGNRYLICREIQSKDGVEMIPYGNENYDVEKSFVSLASTLGPMAFVLDESLELCDVKRLQQLNHKIELWIQKSKKRIERMKLNFQHTNEIQILSGYDTKVSATILESNLVETGLCSVVIHDKGSYCHGRSNLIFQNPNTPIIYLMHTQTPLDDLLLEVLKEEYPNILLFDSLDCDGNILEKEYYLSIQMMYLSYQIARDQNIDLTQPDYNPNVVKKVYAYRGRM